MILQDSSSVLSCQSDVFGRKVFIIVHLLLVSVLTLANNVRHQLCTPHMRTSETVAAKTQSACGEQSVFYAHEFNLSFVTGR